jgi:hypothetical protein
VGVTGQGANYTAFAQKAYPQYSKKINWRKPYSSTNLESEITHTLLYMKPFSFLSLLLLLFCPVGSANDAPEKVIFTRAFADEAYGYYHAQILQRILELTPEFGAAVAEPHPQPMPQARQIIKLQTGEAQVMWSATSAEREKQLLTVRFPLLQGLAGYRVLVIHKFKQGNYPPDMTEQTLQSYLGVQGADWPDLTVLKHNGYKVEGLPWSLWFANMFISVEKGLVDYFPRNVIEVSNDLERHADKLVKLEDNLLLRYPSYEYFFVSPKHPELRRRLYTGLLRMLDNGELKSYFDKHYNHRLALDLATQDTRTIFELENPGISETFKNPLWSVSPAAMREFLQARVAE